jgi:hypothetical protein
MRYPLDLGGWEVLLAMTLLLIGTVVLSFAGAFAARLVGRLWDEAEAFGRSS